MTAANSSTGICICFAQPLVNVLFLRVRFPRVKGLQKISPRKILEGKLAASSHVFVVCLYEIHTKHIIKTRAQK